MYYEKRNRKFPWALLVLFVLVLVGAFLWRYTPKEEASQKTQQGSKEKVQMPPYPEDTIFQIVLSGKTIGFVTRVSQNRGIAPLYTVQGAGFVNLVSQKHGQFTAKITQEKPQLKAAVVELPPGQPLEPAQVAPYTAFLFFSLIENNCQGVVEGKLASPKFLYNNMNFFLYDIKPILGCPLVSTEGKLIGVVVDVERGLAFVLPVAGLVLE